MTDYTELLARIEHVTPELRWAVGQLPAEALQWRPAPEEWSAHEAAFHTRDIERQVYLVRVGRVLREERPALEWFDEVGWHRAHYRPDEPIDAILADYEAAHGAIVALVRDLDAAGWQRLGLHPTAGAQPAYYWARQCYRHALEHVHQIVHVAEAYAQPH
jgi:hypothetical protein